MSYPILSSRDTWYKGNMQKSIITQINITNYYTPTGNEVESWNADIDNNGLIKCYIYDTTLVILSDEIIAMNEDASFTFSSSDDTDYFSSLVSISGTNLLNFDATKYITNVFLGCSSLEYIDVSDWNLSLCESFGGSFENCNNLKLILGLDTWDTSSGKNFQSMFAGCYNLKELDLSNFDTRNASETYTDPHINGVTYGMWRFFGVKSIVDNSIEDMPVRTLKVLKLGKNFSFNGNAINTTGKNYAILFTPDIAYIPTSEGCWFTKEEIACSFEEIPSLTEGAYYTSHPRADEQVSMDYLTLRRMGNEIRKVKQTVDTFTPDEMIEEISSLSAGATSREFVYDNSNIKKFGEGTFRGMEELVSVNAPNATILEGDVFRNCTNLKEVNLNSAIQIWGGVFAECPSLTTLNMPLVELIGGSAFLNCTSLIGEISFPKLTKISGASTFTNTNFTKMEFPSLTTIQGGWNFQGAHKLESITLPLVTSLPDGCLRAAGEHSLSKVDLHVATSIGDGCFRGQKKLETLILRSNNICLLKGDTDTFLNTPIQLGTGYIYVPSALVDTYKTTELWAVYASQFRAIEDYPDICG